MAMRDDIYKSLNAKTTEELKKILDKNDKREYTALAFEVIQEILIERNSISKLQNENELSEAYNERKSSFGKYPALYSISSILKFIAYFILVISIGSLLTGIFFITEGEVMISVILIILSLYFGIISFITMLAFSELIKLFLDIEYNTRREIFKK